MVLTGWQRLGILAAGLWAFFIVGGATIELQVRKDTFGDGLFTCWESMRPPAPPATRHWSRECGVLPRQWATAGFFDDIGPAVTTINTGRVTVFLFLPIALLGLGFLAVGWVRRGFHPVSGEQATLVSTPPPAVMPTIEVKSTEPDLYARQWLRKLTVRWARNGAIAGLATSLLFIVPMLQSPGPGTNSAIGAILVTFVGLSLLAGLVLGFLAKVAIEPHLLISAQSALRKITLTWIYVAIAVATIFFVTDFLFQWRSVRPAGGVVAFIGFFGGHALIGYLISLVSKWGLRLAIEKDKRATAMMS